MPEKTALEIFAGMIPSTTYVTGGRGGDDIFVPGEIIHIAPLNMRTYIDLVSAPGVGDRIITPFLYYLGRHGFKERHKIYEWSEISPVHAQYYQITLQQKQQLEASIKQGLAGISSAISDFDLLFHDERKYREFLEYFRDIEKGKKVKDEALVMKSEQTLKSIFIDQVDVHTGEGIALKLIASRWPTIIVDFQRLKDEDTDPKKIADKLKVTEAEGVVLATKNKLFQKWKELFRETVLGRFNRITELLEARRKSIQEYRNMLRPIIARYRNIRELGETDEGRRFLGRENSWVRRAVAEGFSIDVLMLWAWKHLSIPDIFKSAREAFVEKFDVLKSPLPKGFRSWVKAEMPNWSETDKEKFKTIDSYPTGIEPLDKYVMAFIPVVEQKYGIKLSALEVLDARARFIEACKNYNWIYPYFRTWEIKIVRGVTKYADGMEYENPMFYKFYPYMDSENVMLMRYIELRAKELNNEYYITDLLGETKEGKKVAEIIQERYPELTEKYPELFETTFKRPAVTEKEMNVTELKSNILKKFSDTLKKLAPPTFMFIKSGPYEVAFDDIITGPYFREIRDTMWRPANNYIRARWSIPGFKSGP